MSAGRFRASLLPLVAMVLMFVSHRQSAAMELPVVTPKISCASLAGRVIPLAGELPARILEASEVTDHTGSPYCNVHGYVAPQVGFEVHLPLHNWKQRILFVGCGGYCGRTQRPGVPASDRCEAVDDGEFAVVTTDMGHTAAQADAVWADGNPQGRIDFGYRAVHVTAMLAGELMTIFYGSPARFRYFSGCSDGGREALMEAERFPADFDGIVAGSSMVNGTMNNTFYHAWIVQHLLRRDGSAIFTDAQMAMLHSAVLKSCGTGVDPLQDPMRCSFDAKQLACAGAVVGGCFSPSEVAAIRELYAGPHDEKGHAYYFGLPYGSELNWNAQAKNSLLYAGSFVTYFTTERSHGDADLFAIKFNDETARAMQVSSKIVDSVDPDLAAFAKAGHKLIMWHGWGDSGVPAMSSVHYVNTVRATMGATDSFLRLYLLPGVYHCGGGLGPDKIDLLSPMMAWVEDGTAPGSITARTRSYGREVNSATIAPF